MDYVTEMKLSTNPDSATLSSQWHSVIVSLLGHNRDNGICFCRKGDVKNGM